MQVEDRALTAVYGMKVMKRLCEMVVSVKILVARLCTLSIMFICLIS
jgi:hypothetical protein